MNPLFIFGGLAVIGAMVAMQSQGGNDVDRGNVDDPMFRDDYPGNGIPMPGPEFPIDPVGTGVWTSWEPIDYEKATGASEEAYWSGYGEGRHVQIPGRLG